MAIAIHWDGTGYAVALSPPHAEEWRSDRVLSATEVLAACSQRGCHSTDVTDALDAAGADWRAAHDAELARKREAH